VIDALVFAAGLGTRLRPMTDTIPKALVRVGGSTILERAIRRILLLDPGLIVVNAHHHAEQIEDAVESLNESLAVDEAGEWDRDAGGEPRIVVSVETDRPLETGGGLRHARHLFSSGRPILLHNGDVITDLDLGSLVVAHTDNTRDGRTIATLAVQRRDSSRELLFDAEGLYGRRHVRSGREEIARSPVGESEARAFAGIHVIASELPATLPDREVFSITDHYLALAAAGVRIRPFDMGDAAWWEIGTPERLTSARRALGEDDAGA
jgi:MurNAc alpha-1-phosphate uridylyltransferase